MKTTILQKRKYSRAISVLAAGACAISMAAPAAARPSESTAKTMLDRIQIEEMIINYYAELGSGGHSNLSEYFTENAVFIVNGKKYVGRKAIDDIYAELGAASSDLREGVFNMLLTNLRVQVKGDKATAITVWTGVMNDNIKAPPRIAEQGREYDKLEKHNGVWYFQERIISSDSDMQDQYDDTYTKYRTSSEE